MTQISADSIEGRARGSLLEAITKAVSASLKTFNGGPASINVIVEGYEWDGEEYVAKVRVMVMPHDMEMDNLYHEGEDDRHNRQAEAENFAAGFTAAAHNIEQFDSRHDEAVLAVESHIHAEIQMSTEGKIVLIASDDIHDKLQEEAIKNNLTDDNKLEAPTLDLGGGSSKQTDKAA